MAAGPGDRAPCVLNHYYCTLLLWPPLCGILCGLEELYCGFTDRCFLRHVFRIGAGPTGAMTSAARRRDGRRCILLLLPALALGVTRDGLTQDNFQRLVFDQRKDRGPAFVKFFAPWCGHCKKMAPDWKKLEKAYESSDRLLVGSVDCTDGPASQPGQGGRNPLCDKYRVMGMPTLLFFHRSSKKAQHYDGNKTAEDLLAFAAELASECAVDAKDACTDEQKAYIAQYEDVVYDELKAKAEELSQKSELVRMHMMMVQMESARCASGMNLGHAGRTEVAARVASLADAHSSLPTHLPAASQCNKPTRPRAASRRRRRTLRWRSSRKR